MSVIQFFLGMLSSPSSDEEEEDRRKARSKKGAAPGKSSSARATTAPPSKPSAAAVRGKSSSMSSAARVRSSSSSSARPAAGGRWAEVGVAPFQDGQYVRLFNRGRGGYLFADETGRGVSVDARRGMVNTAWAVRVLETDTNYHVLLRGAYGRHLAVTTVQAAPGHVGCDAAQCVFDDTDEDAHVMWWTTPGKDGSVVLLHGTSANLRALRANGRFRRWNRCVTVEAINRSRVTSMMEWEVQVISLTVERPPYQLRPAGADTQPWHPGSEEKMEVNFVVADDNGSTDARLSIAIPFRGRSLMELGTELAQRLGDGVSFQDITLCIQAGNLGQPTILLTDLPYRDDRIDIVVFRVGTPGHDRLLFPDLDAE